ncbi:MAG: DNA repair protein RadA [Spirochaetes bacterium]|nr:DNA repair protein RadA [Spirochaetota bacterium]
MSKKKNIFLCISCGAEYSKWQGKCPGCGEWNSIVEAESSPAHTKPRRESKVVPLSSIHSDQLKRIITDIDEFNLVCGGGIVPGSVILISGEPGIGKSTIALQIARTLKTLYISGEESPVQLRHRANRLGLSSDNIHVLSSACVEEIQNAVRADKFECLIADSVQTLYTSEIPGSAGSVTQVRESSARLIDLAKSTGIPVILIGHITKDGSIAGPKILEHLVDTVLYFEGDFSKEFRMIRALKNRFGSINEIGLFRMSDAGLVEVSDKNSVFLNSVGSGSSGSAISAAIEGSRTMLFEVQSLVAFTNFSNPRRMSDGFDINRLILLAAVLEKHGFMKLNSHDVFINLAGGFQVNETSADMAVAIAIVSSLKDKPVPRDTGFTGEISLSGEIRPVSQCARRAQEFARSGFKRIIVPEKDASEAKKAFTGEIVPVKTIYEAIDRVF